MNRAFASFVSPDSNGSGVAFLYGGTSEHAPALANPAALAPGPLLIAMSGSIIRVDYRRGILDARRQRI